ncbi:TRAP transporter small permease [Rhodospirillum sp. A1_3_36]|uniref:TRAP transporter small permease n=1 Tax=Rhodospirillum sp. A1_3_36 TaxID=3391666 RepID=UPI0039A65A1B
MRDIMVKVARIMKMLSRVALWISVGGLFFMTAAIAAQVFFRYVLNDSLVWSEPAAVMTMGWFIFLGAAVGIREGYHLSFDVLLYFLNDRYKPVLYTISDAVVVFFGGCMMWFGWSLAAKTAGNKLPSLGISGAFDFIPLIGGGALLAVFAIERIARRAAGLPTARFGETELED